jgi:hypothetical protein
MSHSGEVTALLGETTVQRILDHARGGGMSDQNITNFIQLLGTRPDNILTGRPNILYGKHRQRSARLVSRPPADEMRETLSDWWEEELFALARPAALARLVSAFSHPDVGCKALARTLLARPHIPSKLLPPRHVKTY